jgi:hypothetical protein
VLIEREEIDQKIMNDIIQTFKNLRIFSINIVNHFTKVREISSFGVISGKYDIDAVKHTYSYDRNYMLKMKNDTDFLYSSNLNKYFNFSMDSDPFLTALTDNRDNSNKVAIPLTEEMLQSIRSSQFILLQELIYYEVNRMNNKLEDILLPPKNATSSYKQQRNKRDLKPLPISKSPDVRNAASIKKPLSQHLVVNKKEVGSIRSIQKEQFSKEAVDYEAFNEKSKYDTVELLERKKKIELQSISKKDVSHTPKHSYLDNSILSIKSKKGAVKLEKLIIDDSKVNTHVDDCITPGKREILLHTEKSRVSIVEDMKTYTESDINDIVSQKPLDDSLDFNKSIITQNNKPQDLETIKQSSRRISIAETDIDSFDNSKLTFKLFSENLNKFEKVYNEYLSHVDQEQKVIFKITDRLINNFKGIAPKLILLNYNEQLSGMAIIYFDYANESNIRLVLSHFSTVLFKHYHIILLDLIEYLKNNFLFNEIFLELYHGYKVNNF